MNSRTRLLPLISAALVVALAYVAGALAPSLRSAAAGPQAATSQQTTAVGAAISLLLADPDEEYLYLPMIRR